MLTVEAEMRVELTRTGRKGEGGRRKEKGEVGKDPTRPKQQMPA
jgi:hypothetical protein